jgi:hypothetical protein
VRAPRPVVALVLLAAACSGAPASSSSATTEVTTTGAAQTTTTAPTPTTAVTTTPLDVAEPDQTLLAAVVLFPEDLPEPYQALDLDPRGSGYHPAGASLGDALDPSDEADDIVNYGLTGDFTVSYGTTAGLWISLEAVAFADAAGASGYLADWQHDLAPDTQAGSSDLIAFSAGPVATAADEAVAATYTILYTTGSTNREIAGAVTVVRSGSVLAWIWAAGVDPSAAVADLAPLVEQRLLQAVADGARRDPALLGLAAPPTGVLASFAFDYSYGIETPVADGSFTVEVTGEFQSPDRASCQITYAEGGNQPATSYLVVIGTQVWLGNLAGYQQVPLRHPSALSLLPLCPGHPLFWEMNAFHRLPEREGTPDTVDGVAVVRYDLAGDTGALETLGFFPEEMAEISRYQVARAVDGGWVVEVEVRQEADLAQARQRFGLPDDAAYAGLPAVVVTRLHLARPSDPDIHVEPPLATG